MNTQPNSPNADSAPNISPYARFMQVKEGINAIAKEIEDGGYESLSSAPEEIKSKYQTFNKEWNEIYDTFMQGLEENEVYRKITEEKNAGSLRADVMDTLFEMTDGYLDRVTPELVEEAYSKHT